MSTPPPIPSAPSWQHCARGADTTDPVGCRGIRVPDHAACIAHLGDDDLDTYLASLTAGSPIDHRGTPFTDDLLDRLLIAVRDPTTACSHFGNAHFDGAQFSGVPRFDGVQFTDVVCFAGAQFFGGAWFAGAQFSGFASFVGAQFSGSTWFSGVQFSDKALFDGVNFSGGVDFDGARFSGEAFFSGAQISVAQFDGVQFSDIASFDEVRFSDAASFGGSHFSGVTRFHSAEFSGGVEFGGASFSDDIWFDGAEFVGCANFSEVEFSAGVVFEGAIFHAAPWFAGVQFSGDAWFHRASFFGGVDFGEAEFSGVARFDSVRFGHTHTPQFSAVKFSSAVVFSGAEFSGDVNFSGAQFPVISSWGPVVCGGTVDLSGVVFGAPVMLEVAARQVVFRRTRWQSTAVVRVRHASMDLGDAVLEAPLAVTAHPAPFSTEVGSIMNESTFSGSGAVRVVSVQGVDAAHLVLTDIDLSDCLFSGAFHLDQLRLEGRTILAATPKGLHWKGMLPVRWTRRRTLAEEQHWRAQTAGQPSPAHANTPPDPCKWRTGPHHPDATRTPDPDDVAPLYRQLRKAFEDGKNEPGAADFYYGECEMRRHDRTGTPNAERRLLWVYWLLSGYGLRAGRALGWLAAAMLATIVLLMAFGLPAASLKQQATGIVPSGGGPVTFTIDKQDPKNPTKDRFTTKRFDKALSITLNSVVFRSSGQDLTTAGTYIEMTSRLLEPALLALAVLAVRGRIKR